MEEFAGFPAFRMCTQKHTCTFCDRTYGYSMGREGAQWDQHDPLRPHHSENGPWQNRVHEDLRPVPDDAVPLAHTSVTDDKAWVQCHVRTRL